MRSRYGCIGSLLVLTLISACSGGGNDQRDGDVAPVNRTSIIFNPAFGKVPVPNDLLFGGETANDGTMKVSGDATNPVVSGIDALDGNSLQAPMEIFFDGSLDANQALDARAFVVAGESVIPNLAQNVFVLPLSYPGGDPLVQAKADLNGDGVAESIEVPSFAEAIEYSRALASGDVPALQALAQPKFRAEVVSLDGQTNNVLRIVPLVPMRPKTRYLLVLTDLKDAQGNAVYRSTAYDALRDPNINLAAINSLLVPLRPAILGWDRLAVGYFGFQISVFAKPHMEAEPKTIANVLQTLSFTTTAAEDALTAIAAPETYFEQNLSAAYRKDAIAKVVDGRYSLSGTPAALNNPTDVAINRTLALLLSSATLPDESPNPLYRSAIAAAIGGGADYATLAADASAAFLIQSAAAQAALHVHNSASADSGDKAPYIDIETEAMATVLALTDDNPAALFPIPSARPARFYRVDPIASINENLPAPALVYQGQITLPRYLAATENDAAELLSDSWQASKAIGAAIDVGLGKQVSSTPPSDRVTYRFPFPTKVGDDVVPLLAVMPDETVLSNFGLSRPAKGWPLAIFVHGITTDRSGALPLADALAFACVNGDATGPSGAPCFATLALDLPLHGVAPSGSTVPGLASVIGPNAPVANLPAASPEAPDPLLTERHYNLSANEAGVPVPMDYTNLIGRSGSLFVNLRDFSNARDRFRGMVVDLLNLSASLENMDIDGDGSANDIDTDRLYFVGHSLGALHGVPFVAVNNSEPVQNSVFAVLPKIQAAALLNAGGGIPRLLTNSQNFAAPILGGLAKASDALAPGTSGLETYLNVYQGVLDSVDPTNFAAMLRDSRADTGILLTEIIGDGSPDNPADQTIPNAADARWGSERGPLNGTINGVEVRNLNAPLSGSEPLIAQFGAVKTASATDDGDPAVVISRFIEGSHANPVAVGPTATAPTASEAVFREMLAEIVGFFAANGRVQAPIVVNPEVLEQ